MYKKCTTFITKFEATLKKNHNFSVSYRFFSKKYQNLFRRDENFRAFFAEFCKNLPKFQQTRRLVGILKTATDGRTTLPNGEETSYDLSVEKRREETSFGSKVVDIDSHISFVQD